MTTMTNAKEVTALSKAERTRLRTLEGVVDKHIDGFIEAGKALTEIRDGRLYRAHYKRFADYCEDKWGFRKSQAYHLIEAAGVVENITARQAENVHNCGHGATDPLSAAIVEAGEQTDDYEAPSPPAKLPTTESQARELAKVPAEEQAEVWEEVVATEARPTAAAIKGVVEKRKSAKTGPAAPRVTKEKVHRADAALPEAYIDEEGNPVPEDLWPVWRDMGRFMAVVDGIRASGMLEASRSLCAMGADHSHNGMVEIGLKLAAMHQEAIDLAMSAKPSVVRGKQWFIRAEG